MGWGFAPSAPSTPSSRWSQSSSASAASSAKPFSLLEEEDKKRKEKRRRERVSVQPRPKSHIASVYSFSHRCRSVGPVEGWAGPRGGWGGASDPWLQSFSWHWWNRKVVVVVDWKETRKEVGVGWGWGWDESR